MFTYIKEKIAELIAAYKKRKEEEEAARKFKSICTTVLAVAGVLCVGYVVISAKKLINKLFGAE